MDSLLILWGLLLVCCMLPLTHPKDIYRTYERVDHVYDYKDDTKTKSKTEKDKQNDYEDYWDKVYDSQHGEQVTAKQTDSKSIEIHRNHNGIYDVINSDDIINNNNKAVTMKTPTTEFYDPNVPQCYNCYYGPIDSKAQGTPDCASDDPDRPFSDGAHIMTVPCATGLCSVTRTRFADGGEMVIRGCMENCDDYNSTLCIVQCCLGDRCNGPNIAAYKQRQLSGALGVHFISSSLWLSFLLTMYLSVTTFMRWIRT